MTNDIGKKLKELRKKRGLTLRELSEVSGLSIGFLSQLERNKCTIAVDSLAIIANCLETKISYFIEEGTDGDSLLLKSYEREVLYIENERQISYRITNQMEKKTILPRVFELMPGAEDVDSSLEHSHAGEEFLYVLEGIMTLIMEDISYNLYPGDTAHFDSSKPHNWVNNTNKVVKILTVHTPNPFAE